MIVATRRAECRCEDKEHMEMMAPHVRGYLRPGMLVSELRELCGGCTDRWTCPRLIAVRKRYET